MATRPSCRILTITSAGFSFAQSCGATWRFSQGREVVRAHSGGGAALFRASSALRWPVSRGNCMKMVSPGDARVSVDEAAAYALATHRHALRRLEHISEEYGEELAAFSFSEEEFKELIDLKRARYEYLEKNPDCVREVMEVVADPLLIIRGT